MSYYADHKSTNLRFNLSLKKDLLHLVARSL